MPRRPKHPVLTQGQLNRATLARQLLLARSDAAPLDAIERIGGLQAQEPASPYVGLWTRLADFEARLLDQAFRDRTVLKSSMMRATLHVVSAADYLALQPAISPMIQAIRRQDRLEPPDEHELRRITERAMAYASEPRTLGEIRDHVTGRADGKDPDELLWWVRRQATFVHAPSDVPWSFGRRPRLVAASAWLDGAPFADAAAAIVHLARRYLGAFGPASLADLAAWSGLGVGRLRPGIEALDAEDAIVRFNDARGRELLDLVGAPRPPADRPAPARLLPMWEGIVLAFADRTRVISDEDRAMVVARNGDTLPSFLVDGRVAGLWWAERDAGGRTRIALEPFRSLALTDRQALEREGERLAAFVEPLEPNVYARYRRTRARRCQPG